MNTKRAAEAAERDHVRRALNPAAATELAETEKKSEVPTVREYFETFISGHYEEAKPRHREEVRRMFETYLLNMVGDVALDEFNQHRVNLMRSDLRRKDRTTKTIDNIMTPLSTLLRYAHTNGVIPRVRAKFTKAKARSGRKIDAIPLGDVDKLINATIDPRYRLAILLAAEAGLRQGELRGLRWESVSRDSALIERALDTRNRVTEPKHNIVREVVLSERIVREIDRLPRRGRYLVTRLSDGAPLGYFAMRDKLHEIYAAAGLASPPMLWHCLRHTFGTELARAGVDVATIMELMGHASLVTTQRYLSVVREQKSAAIKQAFGSAARQNGQRVGNNKNQNAGKSNDSPALS